jgi:hypothetical protein
MWGRKTWGRFETFGLWYIGNVKFSWKGMCGMEKDVCTNVGWFSRFYDNYRV